MAEAAEEIEFARRKKLERQSQVDLLLNNIQHLKALYEDTVADKRKLELYKHIAEEMLQIEQAETNDDRVKTAIYECLDKFGNADGLCIDCLLYLPQNY